MEPAAATRTAWGAAAAVALLLLGCGRDARLERACGALARGSDVQTVERTLTRTGARRTLIGEGHFWIKRYRLGLREESCEPYFDGRGRLAGANYRPAW